LVCIYHRRGEDTPTYGNLIFVSILIKICQFAIFLIYVSVFCYALVMNYRRIFADGYSYYITMVTHQRKPILIENIEALRNAFRYSKKRYDYTIDAIVVLPDHLHMVITPKNAKEYPKIITNIKRSFVYKTIGRGILAPTINTENKLTLSPSKHQRKHAAV